MWRRVVLVLIAATTPATAQPRKLTARFQAGVDAFRLGKLAEARTHLEAARDLDPKLPGPHRFLAAVAQAQGQFDECIREARVAIELNPRSTEIADTRALHDRCREDAGRTPYRGELGDSAAIAVTTNVAGATVRINGLAYGGTPLAPRPIAPGTLEVEVSLRGYKPAQRSVDALAGIVTDVAVELEVDPAAEAEATARRLRRLRVETDVAGASVLVDGAPLASEEVAAGTHVVEVRAPGHDVWRRRVRLDRDRTLVPELVVTADREARRRRGFYLLAAGGAALAGGVITALVARSALAEARDIARVERARDPSRPLAETGAITPVRTRADLAAASDRAARWGLVSTISYGVGIAAVVAGAYFVVRGRAADTDGEPPFAIAPLAGGAYVATEIVTW